MSSKWKFLTLVFIAAAVVWTIVIVERRRNIAESNRGHFFRVKVALTYKSAQVDIDVVVGCGVHYSWNRVTSSTEEVSGMTDYFFATKMPEGHAVVIRTVPNAAAGPCWGATTANGDVDRDWLPLIAWFEHDDDFAHGIAYATQDAYENPNARFGFRGATVEAATRADYDAFVANGRKNLWPPYLTDSMTHPKRPWITDPGVSMSAYVQHPSAAWIYSQGIWCIGARRIRLNEKQRAIVHAAWPEAHPKFWGYKTWSKQERAWIDLITEKQRSDRIESTFNASASPEKIAERLEVYPVLADNALAELNSHTPKNDAYIEHVLIDPALKGFKYFDFTAPPELVQAVTNAPATVKEGNITCEVGNYIVPTASGCRQDTHWVVFEEDTFAIISEPPIH